VIDVPGRLRRGMRPGERPFFVTGRQVRRGKPHRGHAAANGNPPSTREASLSHGKDGWLFLGADCEVLLEWQVPAESHSSFGAGRADGEPSPESGPARKASKATLDRNGPEDIEHAEPEWFSSGKAVLNALRDHAETTRRRSAGTLTANRPSFLGVIREPRRRNGFGLIGGEMGGTIP